MKFQLIIDKTAEEEVIARVHERSALTDKPEKLVLQESRQETIPAYTEDEMVLLPILIFTGIFFIGFALVWLIIYLTTRNSTRSLNRQMGA